MPPAYIPMRLQIFDTVWLLEMVPNHYTLYVQCYYSVAYGICLPSIQSPPPSQHTSA